MTQRHIGSAPPAEPMDSAGALGPFGPHHTHAVTEVQKRLANTIEEMNRAWLIRVKAEGQVLADYAQKIAAAKTVPEAAAAWQEWMRHSVEAFAAEGARLFADAQTISSLGAGLFNRTTTGPEK